MEERFEINDFGKASFPQQKKGFITWIVCYGRIKSIEKKYVLFEDNDGFLYLIDRSNFEFEKAVLKIK